MRLDIVDFIAPLAVGIYEAIIWKEQQARQFD